MSAVTHISNQLLNKLKSLYVVVSLTSRRLSTEVHSIKCLDESLCGSNVTVQGWIKSIRKQKEFSFFHINDGTTERLQIVAPSHLLDEACTFNAAVQITGKLVRSPKSKQSVEIQATDIKVVSALDLENFPFNPRKTYPPEYVRQYPHLRPKTNVNSAILRLTSLITNTLQNTLINNDYVNVFTPVITSNDCEGAGEVFTIKPASEGLTRQKDGKSPEESYFNKKVFLTVSGQLHLEAIVGGLPRVFTLGPTFRSENSRTRRHLAEFRMLEAEIAFCYDLEPVLHIIEKLVKETASAVLEKGGKDLKTIANFYEDSNEEPLKELIKSPFAIMTYTEAIELLLKHGSEFKSAPKFGRDVASEHELFLVKYAGGRPVFLVDWPANIKPFYMRSKDSDQNLVSCVDLLVPNVGELCGGSLREHRYDTLEKRLKHLNLADSLQWYLDLRRFGGPPSGGFGMGLERLVSYLLKVPNVKDIVPFPRTPHHCPM